MSVVGAWAILLTAFVLYVFISFRSLNCIKYSILNHCNAPLKLLMFGQWKRWNSVGNNPDVWSSYKVVMLNAVATSLYISHRAHEHSFGVVFQVPWLMYCNIVILIFTVTFALFWSPPTRYEKPSLETDGPSFNSIFVKAFWWKSKYIGEIEKCHQWVSLFYVRWRNTLQFWKDWCYCSWTDAIASTQCESESSLCRVTHT